MICCKDASGSSRRSYDIASKCFAELEEASWPERKIVVLYPPPSDVSKFERDYLQDHAPMVTPQNFEGITKFVASKIIGTPDGSPPPFHRIAELHFPSLAALQKAAGSSGAQQAIAHAVAISSGGRPVFLVAEF